MNRQLEIVFAQRTAELRQELAGRLQQVDVLDKAQLRAEVERFNSRLVECQCEFLKGVTAQTGRSLPEVLSALGVEVPEEMPLAEALGAAALGTGAWAALEFVTVPTTIWWVWPSSTSLAATLASTLGVSATVATWGVAGVAVVAGMWLGNALAASARRDKIVQSLLENFDREVQPQLMDWAREVVRKVENQ